MAFIQYICKADSESLLNSFAPLLENYGMIIPERFKQSKQLYAEFSSFNDNNFSKVNLLISINRNFLDQNLDYVLKFYFY